MSGAAGVAEAVKKEPHALWAIKHGGTIDHTRVVYGPRQECIDNFVFEENLLLVMACELKGRKHVEQGWVVFEAQGYECVRVEIREVQG